MPKIEQTLIVSASPKTVFDHLNTPRNLTDLVPGAVAVKDVESVAGGGWKFRWIRKLCQLEFEGTGECMIHIPYQYMGYILSGDLHNDLSWSLKPVPTGTEVLMHITFELPSLLQRIETLQTLDDEYSLEVEQILNTLHYQLEEQEQLITHPT